MLRHTGLSEALRLPLQFPSVSLLPPPFLQLGCLLLSLLHCFISPTWPLSGPLKPFPGAQQGRAGSEKSELRVDMHSPSHHSPPAPREAEVSGTPRTLTYCYGRRPTQE